MTLELKAENLARMLNRPLVNGACPHCGGDMVHIGTVCAGDHASTNIALCLACGLTAERTFYYGSEHCDPYFVEPDWIKANRWPRMHSAGVAGPHIIRGGP